MVAPVELPAGWEFLSVEAATSEDDSSVRLNFIERREGDEVLPAVVVCVSTQDGCRTDPEGDVEARSVDVDGFDGSVAISGAPEAIAAWQDEMWTVDLGAFRW